MKILLISNMYPSKQKPYGGIFVKNQYEYLKKILAADDSLDIFFMKRKFTTIWGSLFKYFNAFVRFIPRYFKHYDIVHVHFFYPLYILAFLYKIIHPNTKIVVTFHGGDTLDRGFRQKILLLLPRKIDYVIAVSHDLAKLIKKRLNLRVDKILCAGVDRGTFYRLCGVRKEYDFLFVGSFYYIKGIDILLDAIKKFGDSSVNFCFAGCGPYHDQINALSGIYNITIKSNQTHDQLRDLYNRARFLIVPSRQDSFGLVVTEALYCGIPAVVSNNGGLKDQVVDGLNGFILKDNTAEEISATIKLLLQMSNEGYEYLSVNAEKSNAEYSLQVVCDKLVKIYRGLVSD